MAMIAAIAHMGISMCPKVALIDEARFDSLVIPVQVIPLNKTRTSQSKAPRAEMGQTASTRSPRTHINSSYKLTVGSQ